MKKIETIEMNINDLKFNFDNQRKISRCELDDLKKSLETLDDFGIIVIDEHNNVISGAQRVKALVELGRKTVLCKKLIGYTEEEKKIMMFFCKCVMFIEKY